MKILIDARLYGLENAGLGRYVINLINKLSKIDRRNHYLVLLRDKYYRSLKLPDNWIKIRADFRHYSLKEQILLPLYLYRKKADVVHFPHFNVPLFYFGKFVVTIHDLLMQKYSGVETTTLSYPIYWIKRLGYQLVFYKALKSSVAILTPSNAIKSELIQYKKDIADKILVNYEGTDNNIVRYSNRINNLTNYNKVNPYFLYVGSAYPHKNLKKLIEAIKIVNLDKNTKVKLKIVSSRDIFTRRLRREIEIRKASMFVELSGFVSDKKLTELILGSVGFVFPSLSEGFGLPGIEALSVGTVLLASDIKVFREVYGDNPIYFNPKDAKAISIAMKKALALNPDQRLKMVKKGKTFVKRYSWDKMAGQILEVYEKSSHRL